MFWGMTRALDLQGEVCPSYRSTVTQLGDAGESVPLNILLVGTGDARHIIKTLSQAYKHKQRKINFYVYEHHLELIARQILLLLIATEPPQKLGLLEKARIFMEIYGNTFLRPSTFTYLTDKCNQLIHMVTNQDYMERVIPLFDFTHVKYRDRDRLEDIFKFWRSRDKSFDMNKIWDDRLRKMLIRRYDSRDGVFDWDYHMVLKDLGGDRINVNEYKQFRHNGVAFTWLETEYSITNPTFAAFITRLEGKLFHHGYIGDVVSGPFFAYGTETEHKDLNRKVNDVYIKRSTDITQRNLMQYFYELKNNTSYVHHETDDDRSDGIIITEISNAPEMESNETDGKLVVTGDGITTNESKPTKGNSVEEYETISVPNVKVFFLTTPDTSDCLKKPEFKGLFDIVVASQNMIHVLSKDFMTVAKKTGMLIIESRKFVLGVGKDHLKEYPKILQEKVESFNFEEIHKFDPIEHEYAFFKAKEISEE